MIIFHSSFSLFFSLFFYPPHMAFLSFLFFFPFFSLFFSPPHTYPYSFLFYPSFLLFFPCHSSKPQNVPELSFFLSLSFIFIYLFFNFFSFLPFLLALCLLVLGGIDSVLGSGDIESIRVRDKDEAVEFGDSEWLIRKGLEIENGVGIGVGVRGFDWEGFADLIEPRARCCWRIRLQFRPEILSFCYILMFFLFCILRNPNLQAIDFFSLAYLGICYRFFCVWIWKFVGRAKRWDERNEG